MPNMFYRTPELSLDESLEKNTILHSIALLFEIALFIYLHCKTAYNSRKNASISSLSCLKKTQFRKIWGEKKIGIQLKSLTQNRNKSIIQALQNSWHKTSFKRDKSRQREQQQIHALSAACLCILVQNMQSQLRTRRVKRELLQQCNTKNAIVTTKTKTCTNSSHLTTMKWAPRVCEPAGEMKFAWNPNCWQK